MYRQTRSNNENLKNNMLLTNELFNTIWDKAKDSVRHRIHFDLRDSENDDSQRMLNVLEVDTKIPIHRHRDTSEVVIILRGKVREVYFDNQGNEIASYLLEYGSPIPGICVPKGMWHSCECLEAGSVIFESKNGRYDPLSTEESLFKLELLGKGGKDAEESSRIGF